MKNIVALITDFGTRDWFVASVKGVILSRCPGATIVDITHEIAPGDMRTAAFSLLACHATFPKGTVFIAVVDPGVGSKRLALAASGNGYYFVGPDNGVLSPVLDNYYKSEIRALENPKYFLPAVSSTFHGRDIFAPVAAHLAKGLSLARLGPITSDIVRIELPVAKQKDNIFVGTVVHIDHFGNVITSIPSSLVGKHDTVLVRSRSLPLSTCYADVAEGKVCALAGSCGFLELSVNRGSAAADLRLTIGSTVKVRRAENRPIRKKS